MGSKTVVEQFSAWNQQLKTLLQEADRPGDDEKDNDLQAQASSSDDSDDDADNNNKESVRDSLGDLAADLGEDLYSITMYNTGDNFYDVRPDIIVENKLERYDDDAVVADYLSRSSGSIGDNFAINCLIYNAADDEFYEFYSGINQSGFQGGMPQVKSVAQRKVLQDIEQRGREYNRMVKDVDWRPGTEAEGANADRMYNALDALKSALSLKEPVDKIRNVYISPEQEKKNIESSTDSHKAWLAYKAEKEKNKGAGRAKR